MATMGQIKRIVVIGTTAGYPMNSTQWEKQIPVSSIGVWFGMDVVMDKARDRIVFSVGTKSMM